MCGIYGILSLRGGTPPDPRLLATMGDAIAHRGPDDSGAYAADEVALGMRRLSIIDLAGGHQPIANEDQTVWVVGDGEIYNFRELREGLLARGHRFRTGSDAEIVVHLYEEHGADCIAHLTGMFGFALWDTVRKRLVVGRDRLGIKPIYIMREAASREDHTDHFLSLINFEVWARFYLDKHSADDVVLELTEEAAA